jgi:hypothetical protein
MSDFLGNLVARAFSPEVSVKPRLPSAFEPPAGRSPAAAEAGGPLERTEEIAAEPAQSMPGGPEFAPPPEKLSPPANTRIGEAIASPEAITAPPPQTHAAKTALRVKTTPTRIAVEEERAPDLPEQPPARPRTASSPFDKDEREAPALSITTPPASVPEPASAQRNPQPVDARPKPATSIRHEERPTPFSPEPRASASALARPKPVGILVAKRVSPPARGPVPAATPPPAVHVTIGRVEIRAVAPPAGSLRPAPPAAPRLTLDAFLCGQHGGRR